MIQGFSMAMWFHLYWGLAFILILIAGFREVGIDPDSYNYEYAYLHYDNPRLEDAMEPSYFAIAAFFNMFTKNVHAIFLFYAAIGLILKHSSSCITPSSQIT